MSNWIIVYGNVIDGLTFVGPYADYEDAVRATAFERDTEFCLALMDEPEDN